MKAASNGEFRRWQRGMCPALGFNIIFVKRLCFSLSTLLVRYTWYFYEYMYFSFFFKLLIPVFCFKLPLAAYQVVLSILGVKVPFHFEIFLYHYFIDNLTPSGNMAQRELKDLLWTQNSLFASFLEDMAFEKGLENWSGNGGKYFATSGIRSWGPRGAKTQHV